MGRVLASNDRFRAGAPESAFDPKQTFGRPAFRRGGNTFRLFSDVAPSPDRLVVDIDAALEQQVLDVLQRQRG